jgi:hypothetical protein
VPPCRVAAIGLKPARAIPATADDDGCLSELADLAVLGGLCDSGADKEPGERGLSFAGVGGELCELVGLGVG